MYTLTEDEIDSIGALDTVGNIALASLMTLIGSILTFWLTGNLDEAYAPGIVGALAVGALFAGIMLGYSLYTSRGLRQRIKQRRPS